MRVYQADVWCDDCGRDIEERLRAEGKAPEDALDQSSYDSGEFPKWASDDDEADSPQHCAAGEDCLDFTEINGQRYGRFLHNELTSEGVAYVKAAFREGGRVARFWADMYDLTCGACHKLQDDCHCDDDEGGS
jgi:hypothetical protein